MTTIKYSIPQKEEFRAGCREFQKHEKRDAMYKVATFLIKYFWGNAHEMADALGVLLLTWNQAFYRYGQFDFDKLELFIDNNFLTINTLRERDISSLNTGDEEQLKNLFTDLNSSVQIHEGKMAGRKSPVSTAKALRTAFSLRIFFILYFSRSAASDFAISQIRLAAFL